MDYDPEFPIPSRRELEDVRLYFDVEQEFMPNENYLESHRNRQIRKYAIRTIARYTQGERLLAIIPYLAMNYFDRFVSRHSLPNTEANDKENVRLLAVCCLTIASKMRKKSFSVTMFLRRTYLDIPLEKILKVEFSILNGLDWRMRSITAFCFLNHFYPRFKTLGCVTRRSVNQIIVQSQGENCFTRYKPSAIALSSFMAAARIAYPQENLAFTEEEVTPCFRELIELCIRKNIQIERAQHSRIVDCSIEPETIEEQFAEVEPTDLVLILSTPCKEAASKTQIIPMKSVPVIEPKTSVLEIDPAEEARLKRLWNFDLQWITTTDGCEDIPPLETQGTPAASTRDVGNNRDTSDSFNMCVCNCDPRANVPNSLCNIM